LTNKGEIVEKYAEFYGNIATGEFDTKLMELSEAIKDRQVKLGARLSAETIGKFSVGDRVVIQMPPNFSPKYLNGQVAIITAKKVKNVVVKLETPLGCRFDRGLRIDPSHLRPAPAKATANAK
jgi:ribosomal protein L21E